MQIFVSYRRSHSKTIGRLISEDLRERYGHDTVFQDVTEIEPGAVFPEVIRDARRAAHALDQGGWSFLEGVTGDQYVFLLTLKRFLDFTKELFDVQKALARDLIRGIKSTRKGLDDAIREVADMIPVDRYWLRRRLRNETDNMRDVHGALLSLLSRNRSLHSVVPNLQKLYEHLSMWVARYERFRDDEGMCLIFVGVEQNMRFPRKVEDDIRKAVAEFDRSLMFQ